MPQIILIKDLNNTTLISTMSKKMAMLDVYAKLALAEDEIREEKVLDADDSLKELREKYNV